MNGRIAFAVVINNDQEQEIRLLVVGGQAGFPRIVRELVQPDQQIRIQIVAQLIGLSLHSDRSGKHMVFLLHQILFRLFRLLELLPAAYAKQAHTDHHQ